MNIIPVVTPENRSKDPAPELEFTYFLIFIPVRPISPATSAFPYSTLFGFVNVAGLIPTSTRTTKGMLAPGVRVYTGSITLNAGASCALPHKVAGLLFIKNGYSWSGYNMYHIYRTTVNLLGAPDGTNPVSAISASGVL